jgi:hypothetical protein
MKTFDSLPSLANVPADALTARLYENRKEERSLLVEFLAHLAELDQRRVVLALGYPSLFAFCTDFLGLTKSSAFRRTTAARLLARFPSVAAYLADGRLGLTTLVELRDVLEPDRLVEILDRAAGRTEEQVKELVAALRPQPAPLDRFRRLPTSPAAHVGAGPEPNPAGAEAASTAAPAVAPPRSGGRLQPIAPELHVLRITVGADFVADLEAVRQALGHKLPGGRLEAVLHECLRVTLDTCRRRRRGAGKKSSAKTPPAGSRYVPVAVRDQVWRRDGGQCTFVGVTGHRCPSKYRLELHHLVPFGLGGPSTVGNVTLRCKGHNLFAAEQDYGSEHIAQAMARTTS